MENIYCPAIVHKEMMVKIGKAMILIMLILLPLMTFAQIGTKNFIDKNYIEVTGKAEMEVVPNEIYLKIVINEDDFKGKKKLEDLEKSMIKKLQELGIETSKNLSMKDMMSNFQDYWFKGTAINSMREYQLLVSNAKMAGEVFKGLKSLGISNISIKKINHSEIEKYKKEVKIEAIKAAKDKAESLMEAIGQNIGKALYIEELSNRVFHSFEDGGAGFSNIAVKAPYMNSFSRDSAPVIEFEKIKLEYSILTRFEIVE